jgi:hypothetical protein
MAASHFFATVSSALTNAGARTPPSGTLCTTNLAQQALDALLLQWRLEAAPHCINHTCICPLPVAVPYSFPTQLSGQLDAPGAAAAAAISSSSTSAAGNSQEGNPQVFRPRAGWVAAPAALSQLAAASGFEQLLQGAAGSLQRLGSSAGGQGRLREWGFSSADVAELAERLQHLAGLYVANE